MADDSTDTDSDKAERPSRTTSNPSTPNIEAFPTQTQLSSSNSGKYAPSDLITLLVGPKKERLLAHEHRLIKSSEFFHTALKKQWKEGQTHVIELPEECIADTRHYLEFIYEGTLPSNTVTNEDGVKNSAWYGALCALYTFGERVLDTTLRNAIIYEMIRLISLEADDRDQWAPNWHCAAEVYQGTTVGSPIRRFVVDVLVAFGIPEWLDAKHTDECTELLIDTLKEFDKRVGEYQNPADFRRVTLNAEDYLV